MYHFGVHIHNASQGHLVRGPVFNGLVLRHKPNRAFLLSLAPTPGWSGRTRAFTQPQHPSRHDPPFAPRASESRMGENPHMGADAHGVRRPWIKTHRVKTP
jgi:hypothetical protein